MEGYVSKNTFFASFLGFHQAVTRGNLNRREESVLSADKASLQYFHGKLSSHTDRRQTPSAKINIQIPKPVFREGKYPDPEQRLSLFSPRSKGGYDRTRLKANNEHE